MSITKETAERKKLFFEQNGAICELFENKKKGWLVCFNIREAEKAAAALDISTQDFFGLLKEIQ